MTSDDYELEQLRHQESQIEQWWNILETEGLNPSALLRRWQIERNKHSYLTPDIWNRAFNLYSSFFSQLDNMHIKKQELFIAKSYRDIQNLANELHHIFPQKSLIKLDRYHQQLNKTYSNYQLSRHDYGGPNDHQRIHFYQAFFDILNRFSKVVSALDPTMPINREWWIRRAYLSVKKVINGLGKHIYNLFSLILIIVKVIWRLCIIEHKSASFDIDSFFYHLGRLLNYKVVIESQDQLWQFAGDDPMHINLFVPTHRHGVRDNIAFSHLGVAPYHVFVAVDQLPWIPDFLKNRLAHMAGIIAVGHHRGNAVESLLTIAAQQRAQGKSQSVLIYPEGSVPVGLQETRPLRDHFASVLVKSLLEAGFSLSIIPVTYPDNAAFLHEPIAKNDQGLKKLRVLIAAQLAHEFIVDLLNQSSYPFLNMFIRATWIETLPTDSHYFVGQLRIIHMNAKLDRLTEGYRQWSQNIKAEIEEYFVPVLGGDLTLQEEAFFGRPIQTIQFSPQSVSKEGRVSLHNLRDDASEELVLGLREPSHVYLYAGRMRFDGDILRPLSVKERDYLYTGIIIRFQGVSQKVIHAIQDQLSKMKDQKLTTLTCAHSAFQVLRNAGGMVIPGCTFRQKIHYLLPTQIMMRIIREGLIDHQGHIVNFQIYKTGNQSLEDLLQDFQIRESHVILKSKKEAISWPIQLAKTLIKKHHF